MTAKLLAGILTHERTLGFDGAIGKSISVGPS